MIHFQLQLLLLRFTKHVYNYFKINFLSFLFISFIEKLFELKPEIEKCLEHNEFDLRKLIDDGTGLLTNVKIFNEKRDYLMKIDDNMRLQGFDQIRKIK